MVAPLSDNRKSILDPELEEDCSFQTIFAAGGSCMTLDSSVSSSSSCEKISPQCSFSGLRRSTLDLSQIKSSSFPRKMSQEQTFSRCQPSSQSLRIEPLSSIEMETSEKDIQERQLVATSMSNLENMLEEAIFRYLYFLHLFLLTESKIRRTLVDIIFSFENLLRQLVSFIFSNITNASVNQFAAQDFEESLVESYEFADGAQPSIGKEDPPPSHDDPAILQRPTTSDESIEPPLSPSRIVSTSNQESSRDEWGHFADFQDELADELSFIPSCNRGNLNALDTLMEDDEEEEDEDKICF